MKKAMAIILVLAAAALMLCSCGGGSASSTHACSGKWTCKELPEGFSYKTADIEINDDSFTYTLGTAKYSYIFSGSAKTTGSDSMVLYMEKKKQVKKETQSVVREGDAETSGGDSEPVYAKIGDDGKLTLTASNMQMVFERSA